jgi:hypothetical protein
LSNEEQKKRRYSEEEFALILRKASEIQLSDRGSAGEGTAGGLTLDEIRSIAAEAGINPESVTRAASIMGAMEWDEKRSFMSTVFGGPSKFHLDCEIPGRIPPEEMGRILEQIRRAAEHQGEASEVLGGVEWKTVGDLNAINVNISPRDDSTSVQIVGDRSGAGALSFIFPMMASAILVGALGGTFEPTSAAGIISLVTGTLGAGYLTARTLLASGSRKFRKRLTHLMDVVSSSVEKATENTPSERGLPPAEREGSQLEPRG